MKGKKGAFWGLAFLIVLSTSGLIRGFQNEKQLNKTGRYTIGTIERTKIGSKGIIVSISYQVNDHSHETNLMVDYENKPKLRHGKRVFVLYIPKDDDEYIRVNFDCIVPDSIKKSPFNGWTKDWMKKHFIDCVK